MTSQGRLKTQLFCIFKHEQILDTSDFPSQQLSASLVSRAARVAEGFVLGCARGAVTPAGGAAEAVQDCPAPLAGPLAFVHLRGHRMLRPAAGGSFASAAVTEPLSRCEVAA